MRGTNKIINRAMWLVLAEILASFVTATAFAADGADQSTALTIYSLTGGGAVPKELYQPGLAAQMYGANFRQQIPGYAIVKQERAINLGDRRSTVRFTDVASQIEPMTVSFMSLTDPTGTRVLDQNYEFDLVSTDKLMQKFIDQTISVEQSQGDKIETFSGMLLSTAGGIVLKGADGSVQVVNGYSNVQFPELPGGLITRPTLVWDVVTEKPGEHRARVTYETKAITWWADYNLIFAEGKDANSGALDIGAWVSILNQSGGSYKDAKLKLIAGDVQRAPEPQMATGRMKSRAMAAPAMEMDERGFEEKSFFEYHMYTLGRQTTLPDNSTKQIELFPTARQVPCEKVLVYYGLESRYPIFGSPMTDRNFGVQSNKKVDIYLQFKNRKEVGMGIPLPAGRIRVSKLDPADNTLEFIGEDTIDHTPKDEEVLIKLGSAFDVVGERTQTDFKIDTNRHWMDESIEIKLRNHKDQKVKVIVKENLYRWTSWKITEKTHDFEKVDSRTIHFPVEIDKDGEAVIRYSVHYTW
ncbi:MAG: DUF4139 domain-containing protein [Planctomycetes bacterium]|nr:DUF4139 domain-containing protein [Planctomycetota bacterium]MBI3834391.1 DUF4139 domain-containing protein [Planctomycetota bacterium]